MWCLTMSTLRLDIAGARWSNLVAVRVDIHELRRGGRLLDGGDAPFRRHCLFGGGRAFPNQGG